MVPGETTLARCTRMPVKCCLTQPPGLPRFKHSGYFGIVGEVGYVSEQCTTELVSHQMVWRVISPFFAWLT